MRGRDLWKVRGGPWQALPTAHLQGRGGHCDCPEAGGGQGADGPQVTGVVSCGPGLAGVGTRRSALEAALASSCPAATTSVAGHHAPRPVLICKWRHSGAGRPRSPAGGPLPVLCPAGASRALLGTLLPEGTRRQPLEGGRLCRVEGLREGPANPPRLHIRTRSRPSSPSWPPWPGWPWPRTNRRPASAGCRVSRGAAAVGGLWAEDHVHLPVPSSSGASGFRPGLPGLPDPGCRAAGSGHPGPPRLATPAPGLCSPAASHPRLCSHL